MEAVGCCWMFSLAYPVSGERRDSPSFFFFLFFLTSRFTFCSVPQGNSSRRVLRSAVSFLPVARSSATLDFYYSLSAHQPITDGVTRVVAMDLGKEGYIGPTAKIDGSPYGRERAVALLLLLLLHCPRSLLLLHSSPKGVWTKEEEKAAAATDVTGCCQSRGGRRIIRLDPMPISTLTPLTRECITLWENVVYLASLTQARANGQQILSAPAKSWNMFRGTKADAPPRLTVACRAGTNNCLHLLPSFLPSCYISPCGAVLCCCSSCSVFWLERGEAVSFYDGGHASQIITLHWLVVARPLSRPPWRPPQAGDAGFGRRRAANGPIGLPPAAARLNAAARSCCLLIHFPIPQRNSSSSAPSLDLPS